MYICKQKLIAIKKKTKIFYYYLIELCFELSVNRKIVLTLLCRVDSAYRVTEITSNHFPCTILNRLFRLYSRDKSCYRTSELTIDIGDRSLLFSALVRHRHGYESRLISPVPPLRLAAELSATIVPLADYFNSEVPFSVQRPRERCFNFLIHSFYFYHYAI